MGHLGPATTAAIGTGRRNCLLGPWRLLLLLPLIATAAAAASFGTAALGRATAAATTTTRLTVIPGQAGSASYLDSIRGAGAATTTALRSPAATTTTDRREGRDGSKGGGGGRRQRLQRVLSSLRTGAEKDDKPGDGADRNIRSASSESSSSGGKLQRVLDLWGGMRRGSGASSSSRLSLSSPWKSPGGAATATAYAGFPGAPWSPSSLEAPKKLSILKPRAWWSSTTSSAADKNDGPKSDSDAAVDGASPTMDYLSAMSNASSKSASSTTKDQHKSYTPGRSHGSSGGCGGGFPGAAWSPSSLEMSSSSSSSTGASKSSYAPGQSATTGTTTGGGSGGGGFPGAPWSPMSLSSTAAASASTASSSTTSSGTSYSSTSDDRSEPAAASPTSGYLSSVSQSSASSTTGTSVPSSADAIPTSYSSTAGVVSGFPGAAWSPSSLETPKSPGTQQASYSQNGSSGSSSSYSQGSTGGSSLGFSGAAWSPSSLETPAPSATHKAFYSPGSGSSYSQGSNGESPGAAWSPSSLETPVSSETRNPGGGSGNSHGSIGASGFPGAVWSPSSLETSSKHIECSDYMLASSTSTAWSASPSFAREDGYVSQSTASDHGSRESMASQSSLSSQNNERDGMHRSSLVSPQMPAWVTNGGSGSSAWASSAPDSSYNDDISSTMSHGSSSDYRSALSRGSTSVGVNAAYYNEQSWATSGSSSHVGQTAQSDCYGSNTFGTVPSKETENPSKVTNSSGFPGAAWSPNFLESFSSSSSAYSEETNESASPTSNYLGAMSKSSSAQSDQKKSYGPGSGYKKINNGGFPGTSWSPNFLESPSPPSSATSTSTDSDNKVATSMSKENDAQPTSTSQYSTSTARSSSPGKNYQKQSQGRQKSDETERNLGSTIGESTKLQDTATVATTISETTTGTRASGTKQYFSGFLGGMSVESSTPSSSSNYETQVSGADDSKNSRQPGSPSPDSEIYFSGFLGGMSSPSTAPASTSSRHSRDQSFSDQKTNINSFVSASQYASNSDAGSATSKSDRRVADTFKPRIRDSMTGVDQYPPAAYSSRPKNYDMAHADHNRAYAEPSLPRTTRSDDVFTYSAPVHVVDEELRQSLMALQQDVERLANQLAAQEEDLQSLHKLGQSLQEMDNDLQRSTRLEEDEAFVAMQHEIKTLSERLGILEDIQVEADRQQLVKDQTQPTHIEQPLVPLNNYTEPAASDVLYLNVGGMKLDVLRGTLTLFPDSLLAQQFCGEWDDRLVQDEEGRYMIDEDPELFAELVNHLRDRSRRTDRRVSSQAVVDPPSFRGRPGLQARFHRLVDSYALTRHLYGMSICTVHEDPLPSAEPVAGALLTPVENQDADFRDFVLQREGRHERNVESFEIELGSGTCGAVGWSIYDMDRFDGFCFDHDERVVLAILYIYRTGLQESITFRLGDVTKTIPTSAVIRDDGAVRIRCAKRGAEWYVNGVLVAQTPAVCRALSHRVDPAPFVSCTQGSVCFTDIQYVP